MMQRKRTRMKNYISIYEEPSERCGVYAIQDVGEPGGLQRLACIEKGSIRWIPAKDINDCVTIRYRGETKVIVKEGEIDVVKALPSVKPDDLCISRSSAVWLTRSWHISKNDFDICEVNGEYTVCPKTSRGERELVSLKRRGDIVCDPETYECRFVTRKT